MYRFLLAFIFLVSCQIGAENIVEKPSQVSKNESEKMIPSDSFLVYYVFENPTLNESFKQEMVRQLKKLGPVFETADDLLSETEKLAKYQTGQPILEVIVSSLIEESVKNGSKSHRKLPVFEVTLRQVEGIETVNNHRKIAAAIWQKSLYVEDVKDPKELSKKVISALDSIFESFFTEYRSSSSLADSNRPKFFLYL